MSFISFSSFIAKAMLPLILSFPDIKALVALALPENIATKSLSSIPIVQSAPPDGSPVPTEPLPFLRSRCQVPGCSPYRRTNAKLVGFF